MWKILFFIISCLFFSIDAKANQITLITNGSVTGTNGQQIKIFSDFLNLTNFKSEIKITNQNCALAKLLWETNNKTLMLVSHGIDGLTDPNNKACFIDIKKDEIFFWIYTSSYYFCSAGKKTWDDFLKPNSTHIVAIHPENKSVQFFDQLSKRHNNNIKVVKVNTSSVVTTMAKAEEIDFVFRSGIFELDAFKDKCFWSSLPTEKLLDMSEVLPEYKNLSKMFSVNGYFIAKNLNSNEIDKLIFILKESLNSNEMIQIHKKRSYNNNLVNFKNEQEYKNRLDELIEILKNE